MSKASFHSAGWLDIELFIGKFRVQRFTFTDVDIQSFTWQLVLKKNPGARTNIISLTLGNGLSFPMYTDDTLEARFESAQTLIEEGQYYWALIRTDTDEPWLNGWAKLSFGPLGSQGSTQTTTVTIVDQEVAVEFSNIVYVENPTAWGLIGGSISDQTDLSAELAAKQALVNAATALVDGATIALTAIKHTLSTATGRTFTISYTGDDITLEITLTATSATQTFPATSLCVSEGIASGDNLLALSGVSGDKYMIAIKKIGSVYYVVCKNFGQ